MTIVMQRGDVVTLYSYLREADRSLHFLINPARTWSEFLNYYHDQKRREVERFLGQLQKDLPPPPHRPPTPAAIGLWRCLFGKRRARQRSNWLVPAEELAWIIKGMTRFLDLLSQPTKPNAAELLAHRRCLRDAQILIEARFYGMAELKPAEAIGHFDELLPQPTRTRVA